jgi:YidC/Oxa1 family membrane protein insertase
VADAVGPLLDTLGRESFWYRLVDFFVTLGAGSKALGLVLLALVTRLGIHPLTRKQLASMEAMRKLQPQIKALQEEFKDDKQRFQQEIWKLWQENGVNPFGGCWPMLIQMPILIFVYQGIRRYIVRFAESNFLWIRNLAMPDLPLLVAYTASMVVFQKIANRMQPMPADEKQQQQQQMMTWMMPLMFFFFFRTLPSAFILYWLASNLFYFGEQWLFRRHVEREEAMKGVPVAPRRKRSFLMDVMSRAARQTGARSQSGDTSASAMGGPKNNHKQRPTQRKHRRKRK